MRRLTIGLLVLVLLGLPGAHGVAGQQDRPDTFGECVMVGGRIAIRDGWVACMHTVRETERVYGTVATGTGEPIPVEMVMEILIQIETFLLLPQRTVERTAPAKLISCMSEEDEGTPSPCPAT